MGRAQGTFVHRIANISSSVKALLVVIYTYDSREI